MKKHPDIDQLQTTSAKTSVDEFCHSWKRAREQASSAGPLHSGHYKAGCSHSSLRLLHYIYADILLKSGHYLDRHRQGIDVMLVKKINDFRLFRLRTIFLFDAQLNMNMGRIGTNALDALIESGDMADEQYSRPNRSAIDHVVNRRLMFDYLTFGKSPFAMCSCDLAGNYDRIVHAAASLALQRVGIPLSWIYGMFDTIQRMVKRVRTAYGDSEGTYGGDEVEWPFLCKPMGANQGNRIGPPLWSIISSTVFSILRKAGYGIKFIDAISREVYHLVGLAYVDDSDLIMGGKCSFQVAEDMKSALKMWEEVMNATGQAMAPEKSWWYLVDFVWEKGVWTFKDGDTRTDLTATDSDGKVISLKRLIFSKAKKMLGVYLAPNGDKSAEIAYLTEKASTPFYWNLENDPLSSGINYAGRESDIRSIIRPIMDIALPRMTVNRNVSLALRYGPTRLGGIGVPNPFYDQGIKKVVYLVEHLWKDTPTGKLIRRNISSLCLECGLYGNPLQTSPYRFPWVSDKDSWIYFTWTFMFDRDITVERLPGSFLAPSRDHDEALMIGFSRTEATAATLSKLNSCRLFLRVLSLSDITTADGKRVDDAFRMHGRVTPTPKHRNNFHWPRQPCPPFSYWKLWNEFIPKAFCSTNLTLVRPLGSWIRTETMDFPQWDWYEEQTSDRHLAHLWHFHEDGWHRFSPSGARSSRNPCFHCDAEVAQPEKSMLYSRVTAGISSDGKTARVISRSNPKDALAWEAVTISSSFDSSIRITRDMFHHQLSQCAEAKWFITKLTVPQDITALFTDFLLGTAHTASDGSFNPDKRFGTACWRLESLSRRNIIVGLCILPGERLRQNSFRSELGGLLGISICVWALARLALANGVPPDHTWKVIVGCDGYSAMERSLLSSPDRLSTKFKHYDLVAAIMGIWRDIPCSSFPVFVKSHQDDAFPSRDLTRLEKMNVSVDKAAKRYMQMCVAASVPIPSPGTFEFGVPTVTVANVPVSSELYKSLMDHCTANTLRQYWIDNWSLTSAQASALAWDGFERAMIMTSRPQRLFVSKWLARQVNVGPITQRYDATASGICLRCHKERETLKHCLCCSAIRPAVQTRLDHYYSLLSEYGTDPNLVLGIKLCTTHWLKGKSSHIRGVLSEIDCEDTVDALCAQFDFGWFRFLQGQWLQSITSVQQEFFLCTGSSKSFSFWQGKAISAIWDFLWLLHDDRRKFLEQRRDDLDPSGPMARSALESALAELNLGVTTLRPFYHHFFTHTTTTLTNMTVSSLRAWLRNVRIARECDKLTPPLEDEFSPSGKYRSWLFRK